VLSKTDLLYYENVEEILKNSIAFNQPSTLSSWLVQHLFFLLRKMISVGINYYIVADHFEMLALEWSNLDEEITLLS
jgi:hypothetical protein